MEIDDKVPAMGPVIYFGPADAQGVYLPHIDALVISATVAKYTVEHIFVDSGKVVYPLGQFRFLFLWAHNPLGGLGCCLYVPYEAEVSYWRQGDRSHRYVDFQDVNKIPQDFYPLPRIDQLVDSTSGHELLSLMDASQGYHQIMLNPDDQMQVSFITSGNRQKDQHLTDLAEMFDNLRKYHMKLNLAKFAFGMRNGSKYHISYQPRSAIKAQALPKFVNEVTLMEEDKGNWLLHGDGSSTLVGSRARVVLTSLEGNEVEYDFCFNFKASYHEAEYEVLTVVIRMPSHAGAKNLIAYTDSQLVTNKVEGKYEVKKEWMKNTSRR
ncbi:UNVERIFIED_CONTAM: hypothetical protein Scaly_2779100 [Sesamum calycinum]|uniref:Uncharacterized protein n=1 Tax=Sesamum calycinum TaxID=2727403 RepID=A0AAW2IXE4_9LAMI